MKERRARKRRIDGGDEEEAGRKIREAERQEFLMAKSAATEHRPAVP